MKLYNLSEEEISSVIEDQYPGLGLSDGKYEVIGTKMLTRYGHPIKVIFSCKNGQLIVITAYPLKRGVQK